MKKPFLAVLIGGAVVIGAALLVLFALEGNTTKTDREKIEETVHSFIYALARGDTSKACRYLDLPQSGKCMDILSVGGQALTGRANGFRNATASVSFSGLTKASASLGANVVLGLRKRGGEWRIIQGA